MPLRNFLWVGVAWLSWLSAASAQSSSPVQLSTAGLVIETVAERRVLANGAVNYAPAAQLRMGEEIFYTLRVRNATNAPIAEPTIVKLMPKNTRYMADSAVGPAAVVDFSIDGGVTFAPSSELSIRTEGGGARAAQAEDYSAIRWRLRHPLAPGATALLRFRAVFR